MKIVNILFLLTCYSLFSFEYNNNEKNVSSTKNYETIWNANASIDDTIANTSYRPTLNDIRFKGWTSKEWADNEYIQAVRNYIDAYHNGEITDPYLDEYKDYIKGKFVIGDIKPYLLGGTFMYIIFFDNPEKMFSVSVYSEVDLETETVSNYECKGLLLEDDNSGYTQDDILQFLEACPEHKLW